MEKIRVISLKFLHSYSDSGQLEYTCEDIIFVRLSINIARLFNIH